MNGLSRPAQCITMGIAVVFLLLDSGCASYQLTPKPVRTARHGFFDQKFNPANKQTQRQAQRGTYGKDSADSEGSWHHSHAQGHFAQGQAIKAGSHSDKAHAVESLHATGRRSSSGFQWPVSSVEVTSIFGRRGRSVHEGIDLHAPTGTPVYASQAGVVLFAGSKIRGYGRMVVLRHHDKIATIYAHNSELLVHRGQSVNQGQQIAVSGATGHVSGPHVHFEIRRGMAALDPLKFLPRIAGRLTASK